MFAIFWVDSVALTGILGLLIMRYQYSVRRRKHLPPGPVGLPFFGNLFQMPKEGIWNAYNKWSDRYGPVCYVNFAGQEQIILGTSQAAWDLLAKRSTIYSGRPRIHIVHELLSGGLFFPLGPVNDYWRNARRVSHEALKAPIAPKYQPIQLDEARLAIQQLVNCRDPARSKDIIRRSLVSVSFRVIYGTESIALDDPNIERIKVFANRTQQASGSNQLLVEFFPFMERLPDWLAPWRVSAREAFLQETQYLEGLLKDVQRGIESGEQQPCIARSVLEERREGFTQLETAWTLGSVFLASSDTIIETLSWFIFAMVTHPEVQIKAHEELDAVIGRDRLPHFEDFEELTYIRAIIMETMRWRPITPSGVPHQLTEDDTYEGYILPKGAMILPNVWAINRDVELYGPDVDAFRPERYLDPKTNQLLPPRPFTHDESHVSFGFGRRICVGRSVAKQALFIYVASLLWAFKIEPIDSDVLSLDDCVEGGALRTAPAHKFRMKPRFSQVENITLVSKYTSA